MRGGGTRKPVLLVTPYRKRRDDLVDPDSGLHVLRLIPVIPAGTFPVPRLGPTRGNVWPNSGPAAQAGGPPRARALQQAVLRSGGVEDGDVRGFDPKAQSERQRPPSPFYNSCVMEVWLRPEDVRKCLSWRAHSYARADMFELARSTLTHVQTCRRAPMLGIANK